MVIACLKTFSFYFIKILYALISLQFKMCNLTYEVCLKSIGTVCFAQTTLATVIKALFFKVAQCLVVVKM